MRETQAMAAANGGGRLSGVCSTFWPPLFLFCLEVFNRV